MKKDKKILVAINFIKNTIKPAENSETKNTQDTTKSSYEPHWMTYRNE